MPIRRNRDRGVIYVIIAAICLLIFFIGFNIIDNIKDNSSVIETDEKKYDEEKNNEDDEDDEVVIIESPKVLEDVKGVNFIDKKFYDIDVSSFLVKTLLSSNSYMQIVYKLDKRDVSDFGIIKDTISQIIGPISPSWYFKSQLPAIINALDIPKGNSNDNLKEDWIKDAFINDENFAEIDDSKDIILEDIILVEDSIDKIDTNEAINEANNDASEVVKIDIPPEINLKPVKLNKEKSNVLIYHTHGTEAYLPITEGNFRTTKKEYNVVSIGEIISNGLKEKDNNVIHVDKYHDIASYNESYAQSLKTAKDVLSKEKDIKIIFDIHRDAVGEKESEESANKRFKTVIDGKEVARISLVIGPKNDNLEELKNFAFYIKYVSDQMYPGLLREIILKPYGRFNQYLSDYYALVEIGSNANTIDEAKETAKLVSNILDVVIKGIEE